jgi:hypothetical protein
MINIVHSRFVLDRNMEGIPCPFYEHLVSAYIPSLLSPDDPPFSGSSLVHEWEEERGDRNSVLRGRHSHRNHPLHTRPSLTATTLSTVDANAHTPLYVSFPLKREQSATAWPCNLDNLVSYHHLTFFLPISVTYRTPCTSGDTRHAIVHRQVAYISPVPLPRCLRSHHQVLPTSPLPHRQTQLIPI